MEYSFITLFVLIAAVLGYRFLILKKFYLTSQYQTVRTVPINADVNEAIVKSLRESRFTNIQRVDNIFTAHANTTMSSWSEMIRVTYKPDASGNEIEFVSKCAVPTQIFDWGKNRRNAKKFFAKIEHFY